MASQPNSAFLASLDGGPVEQALARAAVFILAAVACFAIAMSAAFYDAFPSTRLGAVLLGVLFLQIQLCPRLFAGREFVLYGLFVVYLFIQLLWAENVALAFNTLVPAVNFCIILLVFGSLVRFHDVRATLTGGLFGIFVAAASYSILVGFPLRYPAWFSYNSMALLYLTGLYLTLLVNGTHRSRLVYMGLAVLFMALVVATTSIKANLGILLGGIAAMCLYWRYFAKVLSRHMVVLLLVVAGAAYGIASNEELFSKLERGVERISLGIEILQTRESIPGYGGFESRKRWFIEGISGWAQNPIFGHGVEVFRNRVGITSHSTPIDLLYNNGLIGFGLFYAVFASVLLRFRDRRQTAQVVPAVRAVVFATLVCFFFITLSGTMHYNTFLAIFVALAVGLLGSSGGRAEKRGQET